MDQTSKKVFIVEDEQDVAEVYSIDLEKEGFEVESVSTGRDALERMKDFAKDEATRPVVVVLDLLLPDISGMEVLRKIKNNTALKSMPVIILTNYSSDKVKEAVRAMEAADYYLKIDISPSELTQIVKQKMS